MKFLVELDDENVALLDSYVAADPVEQVESVKFESIRAALMEDIFYAVLVIREEQLSIRS